MVDQYTILIQAVKFGYKRYGAKGAVAAAVTAGGGYVVATKVVPKVTDVDKEQVDEIYEKYSDDEELGEILGQEFEKRFSNFFDDDDKGAAAATD
jgi:hypothetical protein